MCPFSCVHKPFLKANGNFFLRFCASRLKAFVVKSGKFTTLPCMLSINKPFVRVLCVNFNGNVLFMKNVRNFGLGCVSSHALLPLTNLACLLSFEFKSAVRR